MLISNIKLVIFCFPLVSRGSWVSKNSFKPVLSFLVIFVENAFSALPLSFLMGYVRSVLWSKIKPIHFIKQIIGIKQRRMFSFRVSFSFKENSVCVSFLYPPIDVKKCSKKFKIWKLFTTFKLSIFRCLVHSYNFL